MAKNRDSVAWRVYSGSARDRDLIPDLDYGCPFTPDRFVFCPINIVRGSLTGFGIAFTPSFKLN